MEHRLRENTMRTKKFIIDLKIIPYFKKKCMNEIKASDIRAWQNALMKKGYSETYLKNYFVRSCIYNRVCVVGKKELVYQLVEELKIMQTNIREVTEQFEKTEIDLTPEGLEDMRNDCLDMLKAILWVLDGAKYLWQGNTNGEEKSPDSGNC